MLFGCLPWTAQSEFELLMTIDKAGLRFPPTIEVG